MASVGRVIEIPHFLTAEAVQKQRDIGMTGNGRDPRDVVTVCRAR